MDTEYGYIYIIVHLFKTFTANSNKWNADYVRYEYLSVIHMATDVKSIFIIYNY